MADASGDGVTSAVASRGEPPMAKTKRERRRGGGDYDAIACGAEDGDVVAYCVRQDDALDGPSDFENETPKG